MFHPRNSLALPSHAFFIKVGITRAVLQFSPIMLQALIVALGLLGVHAVPEQVQLNLHSRVAPPGKSLKRRALDPATVPLADFFLGTDLQYVSRPCGAFKSIDTYLYKIDGSAT